MSVEDLAERFEGIKETQRALTNQAKALVPDVLAHFNDWARRKVVPLLKKGHVLEDATMATYQGESGFEVRMGKIWRDEEPIGSYWSSEIYGVAQDYATRTPWVARVITGLDIPK